MHPDVLTTWGIFEGLLGVLSFDKKALANHGVKPEKPKENSFFRIFVCTIPPTRMELGYSSGD
jgi:hypothetical protein